MSFYGQFRQFFHKSEPIWSKQFFSSKIKFLFSALGSMMSRNMCKLRHKLKNAKSLPELTWSWQNKPWCMQCKVRVGKARDFAKRFSKQKSMGWTKLEKVRRTFYKEIPTTCIEDTNGPRTTKKSTFIVNSPPETHSECLYFKSS